MKVLKYTLVTDGPTDANLLPIIDWCLKQSGERLTSGQHAELWRLPQRVVALEERMAQAVKNYPCDVLFVHRDAEREPLDSRMNEIRVAHETLAKLHDQPPTVAVVPVRMLEAWLCFDESAIRKAAGNPHGNDRLDLPLLKRIESKPDPKGDLTAALKAASGLTGRRLKKFDTAAAFWRIVDHIGDFSPLRILPAFQSFEAAIKEANQQGWSSGFYCGMSS